MEAAKFTETSVFMYRPQDVMNQNTEVLK